MRSPGKTVCRKAPRVQISPPPFFVFELAKRNKEQDARMGIRIYQKMHRQKMRFSFVVSAERIDFVLQNLHSASDLKNILRVETKIRTCQSFSEGMVRSPLLMFRETIFRESWG